MYIKSNSGNFHNPCCDSLFLRSTKSNPKQYLNSHSFEWQKERRAEEIDRHYLAMQEAGMDEDVAETLRTRAHQSLQAGSAAAAPAGSPAAAPAGSAAD